MKLNSTSPTAHAARRAASLAVLILLMLTGAAAQEGGGASRQDGQGRKEGRASVLGRVTFSDNGKPVRRAVVMLLTDLNHPASMTTVTDRRGEFRFRGVPAGKYLVAADAPGALSFSSGFSVSDTGFGVEGIERSLGRVTVGEDGEAKVEFSVERGGAVSGRVTYSDGEPVTGANLLLYRSAGGALTRFFTDPVRTDDRGDYRIEGLPAGEYVVGVVEKGAGGERQLPRVEGTGLASRYHPSAASAKEATAVRVEAGAEAEGVDVRLAENELRRLSGVVRWARTGAPARRAVLILRRRDDPGVEVSFNEFLRNITPEDAGKDDTLMRDMSLMAMVSSNAPYTEADEEGRWSFEDVPPGAYLLTAAAPLPSGKTGKPADVKEKGEEGGPDLSDFDRPLTQRRVAVTLAADDVNGEVIELTEGGRVSGRVTVDGGAAPRIGLRISAASSGTGIEALLSPVAWVKPDGTFLLEAVAPGETYLEVTPPRGSRYYVRSITANGADLLRSPLRVANGAEVSGVQIDLRSETVKVSGKILNSGDRRPAAGAGVLLVPADEGLWRSKAGRAFARADAAGEFSAEAAPGEYLIFCWRAGEEPEGSVEAFVRSHLTAARRLSLNPGSAPKVELLVDQPSPERTRN